MLRLKMGEMSAEDKRRAKRSGGQRGTEMTDRGGERMGNECGCGQMEMERIKSKTLASGGGSQARAALWMLRN